MTAKETKVFNQFNEMSKAYPKIQNGDGGEDFTMELMEVEEEDESHYTFSLDLNNTETTYGFDMYFIDWSNWSDKVFFEEFISQIIEQLNEIIIEDYRYRMRILQRN